MGVPAHDQRDFEFAKKYKLNIKTVVRPKDKNSNFHPAVGEADTRLLNRMRCSAVSAVYGAGMHPNSSLWVSNPRKSEVSNFLPKNKYK